MPRQNIDYTKSVIYKIEHEDKPDLLYVGSTTDFTRRKCNHKSNCNNESSKSYNYKLYTMIRANGGWDSFKIMIIKELNCNSKVELLIEEDNMIKILKSNLNMIRSHTTDDEKKAYYIDYNQSDTRKASLKTYSSTIIDCICGCSINKSSQAQHRRTQKHLIFLQNNSDVLDV